MVGIAVVFGLLAVFVAQGWLNYQAELSRRIVAPKRKAGRDAHDRHCGRTAAFRHARHARTICARSTWPEEALPAGTFGSIAELMSGGKRIVLASIEKNEPILRTKITGPGTEGDALGGDPGRHARRHGARERRRRRRRLRAAGRPCRRAAHAPAGAHQRHERRGDPERARARGRSARRRRGRPADRREGGHARGRHDRRRRRSRSPPRSAISR